MLYIAIEASQNLKSNILWINHDIVWGFFSTDAVHAEKYYICSRELKESSHLSLSNQGVAWNFGPAYPYHKNKKSGQQQIRHLCWMPYTVNRRAYIIESLIQNARD